MWGLSHFLGTSPKQRRPFLRVKTQGPAGLTAGRLFCLAGTWEAPRAAQHAAEQHRKKMARAASRRGPAPLIFLQAFDHVLQKGIQLGEILPDVARENLCKDLGSRLPGQLSRLFAGAGQ